MERRMATYNQARTKSIAPFLILIVASGLVWGLLPAFPMQSTHAMSGHRKEAVAALRCKPDDNLVVFQNVRTNRLGYICLTTGGRWAIVICCAISGYIVTAFIKNKMKRKEQVYKYMENAGYKKM